MNKHSIFWEKNTNKYKHILRIMRIIAFMFFFSIMFSHATTSHSQDTKISLHLKSTTIKEACKEIEKQSGLVFVFADDTEDAIVKKVNVRANSRSISNILEDLLSNAGLKYRILEKQVVIYKEEKKIVPLEIRNIILNEEIQQLKKTITGRVVDQQGESIIGANVVEVGSTNGTITDVDGRFSLSVEENALLRISYIGYNNQEISTRGKTTLSITLQEDIQSLEEMVVVGYGSQKKASLVGAIVSTNAEAISRSGNPTNLAQALTGQLPGVTTITSTGEPGEDNPRILIRAQGTWNNSEPLVLVDGVERKMNDIDVSEVETISVLKDASATAVYGVKGSEGVILITTKRGKEGKAKLTVDANTAFKFISRVPDKLNSYDALLWRNTAIERELAVLETNWGQITPYDQVLLYQDGPHRNQYIPNTPYKYSEVFPDVDWADEMTKDLASSQRVNLNISGGTKFAKYFGSLAYTHEGDLMKSDLPNDQPYQAQWAYDRFNFRTNLDFNLTGSTILSVNLSGYVGKKMDSFNVSTSGDADFWTPFYNLSPSAFIPRWEDGYWGYTTKANVANPVAGLNNSGVEKHVRSQLTSDFTLRQELDFITKGLSFTAMLSYDTQFSSVGGTWDRSGAVKSRWVNPNIIYMDPLTESINDYVEGTDKNNLDWAPTPVYYYPENFGNIRGDGTDYWGVGSKHPPYRRLYYQGKIDWIRTLGLHDIAVTAVMNREEYASGSEFPRYREDWVGRITYNYDTRYLFETNAAYNGSEKFTREYRFGFFPSVALGWVVSNERFMEKLTWLDHFKIRYSIGKVGNDNYSGARWEYMTLWALDGRTRFGPNYTNSIYEQYIQSRVGNPDLKWEESTKQNLGFEVAVLKNLLNLNIEIFKDDRSGIFMTGSQRTSVPSMFGASPVSANIGETTSKGYEIELKFRKNFGKDLYLWTNLSRTHAKDKIVYMEDAELLPGYQKREGFQIGQTKSVLQHGYVDNWNEFYATTAANSGNGQRLPGDVYLIDFNGDGVIDSFDSAPYGYPTRPQNTHNMTFGIDYKRWSLMLQFYAVNNVTRNMDRFTPLQDNLNSTVYAIQNDYWTNDNPNASWKAPRFNDATSNGTLQLYDASYVRLKTAELSYRADSKWLKSMGISTVRLYLNGNNLFLWTAMPDDREDNSAGYSAYPVTRRINMGMSVNF